MTYTFDPDNIENLLSELKDDDIVQILGEDLIKLLNSGKGCKGRKPIPVDLPLFDEVVERWNNGEITAREAMRQLDLKPNTFYRRIKEYNERNNVEMTELKKEIKEAKKMIHEDTKAAKKDIKELKHKARSDASEVLLATAEKKKLLDMEMEIRAEKINAELSHREDVEALRAEVEKETANQKAVTE